METQPLGSGNQAKAQNIQNHNRIQIPPNQIEPVGIREVVQKNRDVDSGQETRRRRNEIEKAISEYSKGEKSQEGLERLRQTLKILVKGNRFREKVTMGGLEPRSTSLTEHGMTLVAPMTKGRIGVYIKTSSKEEFHPSQILKGHSGEVTSVSVTPDGRTIVSGSHDRSVKVWVSRNTEGEEPESFELFQTLDDHSDTVWTVSVTPDGKCIVSGSWDNSLKVWMRKEGDGETCYELLQTLEGHFGVSNARCDYCCVWFK